MKTIIFNKLVITLVMALASLGTSATSVQWHDFYFVVDSRIGPGDERVALLMRAKILDQQCWLQLDTGMPSQLVWHSGSTNPLRGTTSQTIPVRVGDVEKNVLADIETLQALRKGTCPVGSIGNGFFEHGTLSLDMRASRFSFIKGPSLTVDTDAQPMQYLRSSEEGGYLLLHARMFDGAPGTLMLDTGSARFGMATNSFAQWQTLSGALALNATTVRSFPIKNVMDAAPLRCYETVTHESISLAGRQIMPGILSYCEKDFSLPVPLDGILGLRAFSDYQITFDYVTQRWKLEPGAAVEHVSDSQTSGDNG